MSDEIGKTAWIKLYHHCGALVTIPIDLAVPITPGMAGDLWDSIDSLVKAGFSADPPRLEEGEEKIACRYLVRRGRVAEDGTPTTVIDLYLDHEQMTFPALTVYLNTDKDVADCCRATGIDLMRVPEYVGQGKLEKTKDPRIQAYFARFQQPVNVIRKVNPKFNQPEREATVARGQVYKIPHYKFLRWADLPQAPAEQQQASPPPPQQQQQPAPNGHQPLPQGPSKHAIAASAMLAGQYISFFDACNTREEAEHVRNNLREVSSRLIGSDGELVNQAIVRLRQRLAPPAQQPAPEQLPQYDDNYQPDGTPF